MTDLNATLAKSKSPVDALISNLLPDLINIANVGGATSIDVTRPGIDRVCGIGKLASTLGVPKRQLRYIGGALFPGGNDYLAEQTGVRSIEVRDPEDAKKVIQAILACLDEA